MKEIIICNIIAAAIVGAVLIPLALASSSPYKSQKDEVYEAADKGGDALRSLMSEGISINSIDEHGKTALMDAADNNKPQIVQTLISNGANVNMQDETGQTALMMAAEDGSTQIVGMLLDADAETRTRDYKGETALEKAEKAGFRDTSGFIGRSGGH